MTYVESVKRELTAMRESGLYDVPDRALELCDDAGTEAYERTGLSVSECADLLIDLARIS